MRAAAPLSLLVGLTLLVWLGLAPLAIGAGPASDIGPALTRSLPSVMAQAAGEEAEPADEDAPMLAGDEVADAEATAAAAGSEDAASQVESTGAPVPPSSAPETSSAADAAPAAPVAAAPAPPRPTAAEPLDFPGAAVDVTLKLVAVLALAYLTLALVKRYSLGATLGKRSSAMQVIESTTLAPNRSIYLVNVEGRRLLLGVTASQITTLAAWDGDGVPQPVPAPTPAPIALDEPATAK
jgi:flagellar biosynthetic protein FliO